MKHIEGIPVYVIDSKYDKGPIFTVGVKSRNKFYGRTTLLENFTELPEYLTPNKLNLLSEEVFQRLLSERESYLNKEKPGSVRVTIYEEPYKQKGFYRSIFVLQSQGTDIMTSSNYMDYDVIAFKSINKQKTSILLKAINPTIPFTDIKSYQFIRGQFEGLFSDIGNEIERSSKAFDTMALFSGCLYPLFYKDRYPVLSLTGIKNIPSDNIKKVQDEVKKYSTLFILPHEADLKFDDFCDSGIDLTEDLYKHVVDGKD